MGALLPSSYCGGRRRMNWVPADPQSGLSRLLHSPEMVRNLSLVGFRIQRRGSVRTGQTSNAEIFHLVWNEIDRGRLCSDYLWHVH